MLNFASSQKVYNIGGVELGGQPGERPTVLIGSIFFAGHRIVHDPVRGLFDRELAKDLLHQEAELSIRYGNPRFVDVIGETTEALVNYIEFVAEQTSSPILVDSPSQRVRLETVRHFAHSEVMPRLIYNAIAEDHTEEELDCLRGIAWHLQHIEDLLGRREARCQIQHRLGQIQVTFLDG